MADRVDDHTAGTTTFTMPLGTTREQLIDLRKFCVDRGVAVATMAGAEGSNAVIAIAGEIERYILNGAPAVADEDRERRAVHVTDHVGMTHPRERFRL